VESAGIDSGGGWVRGEITRGIVEPERSGRQHGVWCRDRREWVPGFARYPLGSELREEVPLPVSLSSHSLLFTA